MDLGVAQSHCQTSGVVARQFPACGAAAAMMAVVGNFFFFFKLKKKEGGGGLNLVFCKLFFVFLL